jgi:hypothetical protein
MSDYSIIEGRDKTEVKYLKSMLDTKVNQYKMLSGTLAQMLSKNPNYTNEAKQVKNELNETLEQIIQMKRDLDKLVYGTMFSNCHSCPKDDDNVTYSFYNKVKKQEPKKAVFDILLDDDKTPKLKEDVNELRNIAENRIKGNRFLVRVEKALGVPEIMVSSASFNLSDKEMSLCIYDFLSDVGDGSKIPILEILKYTTNEFNFSIDHLDAKGNVIYTEWYDKCRIKSVYRDPIDYSSDDFSKIQILITYDNVEYETANEEEEQCER